MAHFKPVLIAEDEADDALLIQMAFRKTQTRHPIQAVTNGEEAIWYLAGEGRFANRTTYPFPALLMLDLKMPVLDGFEVLRWLNRRPDIKDGLPVVVLSSSHWPLAVKTANELGVVDFLQKPISFSELCKLMQRVKEQWLDRQDKP